MLLLNYSHSSSESKHYITVEDISTGSITHKMYFSEDYLFWHKRLIEKSHTDEVFEELDVVEGD